MDDARLLRLLHKDPGAGMEQLMNQYAGLVYAVIRGRLCDAVHVSTDIEDCVADTFSEFFLGLERFNPKQAGIKTYLCTIARNNATDLLRRREKLKGSISLDDEESLLQPADDMVMEGNLVEENLRREIFRAVEKLGWPDADILFRKYYYNESSKAIAEALGLTASNVDTRTHRALNKLRKKFGGSK